MLEQDKLVILECDRLWVNKEKEFLPTLHANGDGTFRTDSDKVINLREKCACGFRAGQKDFERSRKVVNPMVYYLKRGVISDRT